MNELSGILIATTVCALIMKFSPPIVGANCHRHGNFSSHWKFIAMPRCLDGRVRSHDGATCCGAVKFTQSITKLARFLHRSRLMGSNQIVALPRDKFLFTYAATRWRRVIIGVEVHSTLKSNIYLMWWTITRLWLRAWAIPDQLDVCVFVSSAQKVWNFCIFWHFERPTCADQMLLSDPRNV